MGRSFLQSIRSFVAAFTITERLFLCGLALALTIGIWHALPIVGVIGDEAPFVGGVLRAVSAGAIVPEIDYSYTLSFYANYLLMIPVLAISFVFSGFSLPALMEMLTANHHLLYLVPRTVTALSGVGIGSLLLALAREEGMAVRSRLTVVGLFFTTIIVTVILHTGKMWGLSAFFLAASVYFTARALRAPEEDGKSWFYSPHFWAIGFAFLAFANFPILVVALAVVPFVLWCQRSSRTMLLRLLGYFACWSGIFAALFALNMHGWTTQNSITPVGDSAPSTWASIIHHATLFFTVLPALTVVFLSRLGSIRNKPLFALLAAQFVAFLALIIYRAPWAAGSAGYYRYEFIPALFLALLLTTVAPKRERIAALLLGVSLVFFAKTIWLLAVPTTYNVVRDALVERFAAKDVVVAVEVQELDLPKNTPSYLLNAESHCASRCRAGREKEYAPELRYLVIDDETDLDRAAQALSEGKPVYAVVDAENFGGRDPIMTFENGLSEGYYSVEHGLGVYATDLFAADRLGRTVYVYEQ